MVVRGGGHHLDLFGLDDLLLLLLLHLLLAADRSACAGFAVPVRPGWNHRHSRCFRLRQDCHLAVALEVLQLGRHRVRRLR